MHEWPERADDGTMPAIHAVPAQWGVWRGDRRKSLRRVARLRYRLTLTGRPPEGTARVTVSSRIAALAIVIAVLTPAVRAAAATAPAQAPLLVSPVLASPVTIHWTPSVENGGVAAEPEHGHGHGHGHGHRHDGEADSDKNAVQLVLRGEGPCGSGVGRAIASFTDPAISDFTDPAPDGTYCYSIAVRDDSTTAVSPGLTVVVSTRVVAAVPTASASPSPGPIAASSPAAQDTVAPAAPGKISFSFARGAAARVRVTLRWANPDAADLDRVELVLNRKHPPRTHSDGHVVYRGLAHSFALTLGAGETAHLALYAIDRSGNISAASRTRVSPAALPAMRPLNGSSVHAAPLLRWEPRSGVAYYNLQVFQRGKRVLVAWPRRASYHFPAGKLQPGTYVWFVWPALGGNHSTPRFGDLIGRATFAYVH
jgi:hypothetical protein